MGGLKCVDCRSLLRPEIIESLFYMHRATGDDTYRRWGLEIFSAFKRYSHVKTGGYTAYGDVRLESNGQMDQVDSFWLAETLKYLWLLFGGWPDLDLGKWVFNTEAHPLRLSV